ncbi:hypothetical protein COLO4_11422 [Corchorus olitorius]|uniref:Uncharacterized protein n=1 Tax=Corchorus olitorius TaxID=93759 RepID=A0A1R3K4I8_9ROSI|nr:hypothetical protein COLO4_11422 [Corchorus olitorius]
MAVVYGGSKRACSDFGDLLGAKRKVSVNSET